MVSGKKLPYGSGSLGDCVVVGLCPWLVSLTYIILYSACVVIGDLDAKGTEVVNGIVKLGG
jgi:hypothetical protein